MIAKVCHCWSSFQLAHVHAQQVVSGITEIKQNILSDSTECRPPT